MWASARGQIAQRLAVKSLDRDLVDFAGGQPRVEA